LYPLVALRPRPVMSLLARVYFLLCCVGSGALYLTLIVFVRSLIRVPIYVVALLMFPLAIGPAFLVAVFVWRIPRVIRLRCRKCPWKGLYIAQTWS
jgi:hypothetical protein